jgi:hypothetical protein
MKKLITSYLIASTIALSPAVRAQDTLPPQASTDEPASPDQDSETPLTPSDPPPSAQEATTLDVESNDSDENEGTPVGQAANEGSNAAKKKQWQNIALAVGAVAVAVTALILIASNDGHSSKKD